MIIRTRSAQKAESQPIVKELPKKEEHKAPIQQPTPRPVREEKRKKVEEIVPTYSGLVPEQEENEE